MPDEPILRVDKLTTAFRLGGEWYPAVRGVSFDLAANETLALVGESGCGKSITALSILGLVPTVNGRVEGSIRFDGQELVGAEEETLRRLRGDKISMIFQEPMTSLNPVLTVGFQVAEVLSYHRELSRREAREQALALLNEVKIPAAQQRYNDYPHQFSGGMRQRVMIAMALACQPRVLLADEPTTALDVTIQAQVLSLLTELKDSHGMSMVFITHNLGVVATIADRVAVMYAGEIVELAPVAELFARPTHPYTEALLSSIPRVDRETVELSAIPGQVPPITRMPEGCRYAPRCPLVQDICAQPPQLIATGEAGHQVRCWARTDSSNLNRPSSAG